MTPEEVAGNLATYEHLDKVRIALRVLAVELLKRGETHDRSKMHPPERNTFAEYSPKLKGLTYGSDEYKACLAEMKPALDHHYAHNRHHPENYRNGIAGMHLVDLVEMFCDWYASCKRHADGDVFKSIEINRERFGMDPQLVAIFRNTAGALGLLLEGPSGFGQPPTQRECP